MTEEKQGAAEWLRGIADKYDVEGGVGCREAAELFGLCCDEIGTCQECRVKAIRAIADRIDAERALPEGVEWPRFEDGELVKVGDEVELEGETVKVLDVAFSAVRFSLGVGTAATSWRAYGDYGERVKRPTPKVLGADGVPIKVGDTVYFVGGSGTRFAVKDIGFEPDGPFVDIIDEDRYSAMVNPESLTHERPDSWERLEQDAKGGPTGYARDILGVNVRTTTTSEDYEAFASDIVRRAKALAKAGE